MNVHIVQVVGEKNSKGSHSPIGLRGEGGINGEGLNGSV